MSFSAFICQICDKDFDLGDHHPQMLPCGHSFCAMCVKDILLHCPLDDDKCRPCEQWKESRSFPPNFALIFLLKRNCLIHDKRKQLICLEDKTEICLYCAKFGDHKKHKVRFVEPEGGVCLTHREKNKWFCFENQKLMCGSCISLGKITTAKRLTELTTEEKEVVSKIEPPYQKTREFIYH